MHYLVVGLSHKTAPIELREKLAVPTQRIREVLPLFLKGESVSEAMLISTCNRVESYLVTCDLESGRSHARKVLASLGGVAEEKLNGSLYQKSEAEAIAHLFRVAASLDSMVVGEPQISGQVKEAYAQALGANATGTYLNRLLHRTLQVAKRIRKETSIGQYPVSIAYAAVVLAGQIFGNLREKRVLILGAGEMGELVGRHLREKKIAGISIFNRTRSKAEVLAHELQGEVIEEGALPAALSQADIVVSSIGGEQPLISRSGVEEAVNRRKGQSMFLIDLSVPRSIEPEANRVANVYLYNVDDLKKIVEANRGEREREAGKAEEIIHKEVGLFIKSLREIELAPTLQGLTQTFDQIRRDELNRFLARYPDLSPPVRGALEEMTNGMIHKMLHGPIVQLRKLFGLDPS